MHHDRSIELLGIRSEINIVSIGIVYRRPLQPGATFVFFGPQHHKISYRIWLAAMSMAKNTKTTDGKFS